MRNSVAVALGLALSVALAGCASPEIPGEDSEVTPSDNATEDVQGRTIVSTTTILGSVVGQIVECVDNPALRHEVLMPIGSDPHDFQASSEQLALMTDSGLVVANGLGLEQGIDDALDQISQDGGKVLRVAEWANPIPLSDTVQHNHDHDEEKSEEQDDHGDLDAHFWLDMSRVSSVVDRLGSEWEAELGSEFATCASQLAQDIAQAEQDVIDTLATIPEEKRILITDHSAFGYFAERYRFDIAGVVIPGGSTLAEPSSQELAALVDTVRASGVNAIFGDYFGSSNLLTAIASESGGDIEVVLLYEGSIGEQGSEAEDYVSMMRTNARVIAEALGS